MTNRSVAQVHDQSHVLEQVLAQRKRVATRSAQIKHMIAVMSGKGGVGKSALTANLATAWALQGRAVGVLDADIHGASAAAMLGVRGQQVEMSAEGARPAIGVADVRVMSIDLFLESEDTPVAWHHPGGLAADAYVWRGSLEANVLREFLADTVWGALDYLLIDMPPGADRFDTLMRLAPNLSGAVVVTIPSQAAHRVVRRAIRAARATGGRVLGLVENMAGLADAGDASLEPSFPEAGGETFAAATGLCYLGRVPFDPRLARTTDAGRPFLWAHAETPAGMAILALAQKLEEVLEP
jgi:ATP-binding protein involved in chromosome partitioning